MKERLKRLLAGAMALSMAGMCVVTSFAASEEDLLLEENFGTSDYQEIAADAVQELLEEEAESDPSEVEPEEEASEPAQDQPEAKEPQQEPAASEPAEEELSSAAGAEAEEPTATIQWEVSEDRYQEEASYSYTGEKISPDYQVVQDGTVLPKQENWEERWYTDEDCTQTATDFVNCGTIYLQLVETEDPEAVIAQGSYAIVPVPQEITGVEESYSKYHKIQFQLSPQAQGALSYESADEGIATVTDEGLVTITGMGATTVTITAAATRNYQEAQRTVTVKGIQRKQKVKTSEESYSKKYSKNDTFSLKATTNGGGKLSYKSSDTDVVTVSSSGKCTMKGVGEATITVTAAATTYYKKTSIKVEVQIYSRAKKLSYSSSYKNRKYYKALMALKLVGSRRSNIVEIALSQLGYHEGKNKNQLGGNGTGSGNYTEYGRYYGLTQGAWCAMFVSWCAREAGVGTGVIPKYCAVRDYHKFFKNKKRYYTWTKVRQKKYQPKKGDIILYANVKGGTAHHIGYVISTSYSSKKVTITTVEGNTKDEVRKVKMNMNRSSGSGKVNGHYILGIAKPNY